MKREINCIACASYWPKAMSIGPDTDPLEVAERQASGEGIVQIRGTLKASAICDGCGGDLHPGETATATSIYTTAAPYFTWEQEYLEIEEGAS